MVAAPKQQSIGGLEDPAERRASIEAGFVWREQLWSALRQFAANYVSANGLKGFDACAAELDERWGTKGRPVSASVLRACLYDVERNNLRAEWLFWFAEQDAEIADLLARKVRPVKTPEDRLADLEAELREELSHKRAEQVLRRARAR